MITVQINEYNQPTTLAVVVGGGPAPVIERKSDIFPPEKKSALTIQAKNYAKFELGQYLRVIGFIGGFSTLIDGDPNKVQYKELNIDYTSRIHKTGGSIINTSRTSPLAFLNNVVNNLIHYNVRYICTIGGDGTALVSAKIAEQITKMNKQIQVVHVPKTIDNDLPLPGGAVTFGFETAKQVGSTIVQNLIYDARSIDGYHLVITMGRTTGHLAFGIGKSTGACLTVIPEDYHKEKFRMEHLLLDIELCVLKRMLKRKHNYGTIIVAEGLLCHMPEEDLIKYFGSESTTKDANALHIDLGKIDIGDFIRDNLRSKKYPFSFHVCRMGYELRCADPNAFDISYTMNLGHAAANFLLHHKGSHAMVIEVAKKIEYMPFTELLDAESGKTKMRYLDINHGGYRVGAKLNKMNRFEKEDLQDTAFMEKLKLAGISAEACRELVFDVRRYPDYIEPDKSIAKMSSEDNSKGCENDLDAFSA